MPWATSPSYDTTYYSRLNINNVVEYNESAPWILKLCVKTHEQNNDLGAIVVESIVGK